MIKKLFYLLFITASFSYATEDVATSFYVENEQRVDCLILKDENSIICKYMFPRELEDKKLLFEWINPKNEVTRQRDIIAPAGHGSAYDFRYLEGRTKGVWTFKVTDKEKILTTNFELK